MAVMNLHPGRITLALGGAALLLVLAHLGVLLASHATGHDHVYGLVPLFDLDQEANLPSYFSALLLLACAALSMLVASAWTPGGNDNPRGWQLLALLLLAMSVDEAAGLHELLIRPMRELLGSHADGMLYFAWVVPGSLLALALGLAFRGFYLGLPLALRRRILLALTLYLGGALGIELLGGRYAAAHSIDDILYQLVLVSIEEGLEMAGLVVLIHALLQHLAADAPQLRLVFAGPPVLRPVRRPHAGSLIRARTLPDALLEQVLSRPGPGRRHLHTPGSGASPPR